MINSISSGGSGRIGPTRLAVERGQPASKGSNDQQRTATGAAANTASEVAALGPPIDAAKIAAVKAAIAEGRYPLDPAKIADRMVALGFRPR
jgi:negative regulator of flagellin synthesis FlgM